MKSVYGVFCSKHTEAIQMYKEIAKNDRKFQNFCRVMNFSEFVLKGVNEMMYVG